MAANSNIEWTDATVNFWWGCTKVGPGCDHCYAETLSNRFDSPSLWGVGAPRRKINGAVALLQKLNKASDPAKPTRVFIQSMSDLFDNEVNLDWFHEAWYNIKRATNLEIQIVTKRISMVGRRLTAINERHWPQHVGLMVTVCNQAEADRDIPRLIAHKSNFSIPWVGLSCEPLLGIVDLTWIAEPDDIKDGVIDALLGCNWVMAEKGYPYQSAHPDRHYVKSRRVVSSSYEINQNRKLDWVVCGGESGTGSRPMHPDWARTLRNQCAAAGVPFFFKQWGDFKELDNLDGTTDTKVVDADSGEADDWLARCKAPTFLSVDGQRFHHVDDIPENKLARLLDHIGKTAAGDLLDGVQHHNWPETKP
jgi:protein gp37